MQTDVTVHCQKQIHIYLVCFKKASEHVQVIIATILWTITNLCSEKKLAMIVLSNSICPILQSKQMKIEFKFMFNLQLKC